MSRRLVIGAAVLLLAGLVLLPGAAQAQRRWGPELQRLHSLCDQGYKPACIRFGYILGANQGRHQQWRRDHPNWFWWQPWMR